MLPISIESFLPLELFSSRLNENGSILKSEIFIVSGY